jgi:hypothetical protein
LANTTYIFSAKANVFSGASWNQSFLIQSVPSGSTLTFQQDDGEVITNGNSVLSTQNNSILKAILVVGSTAGTVDARFGVGISSNSTSDIEFYEPQFEIGSTRSTYQLSGLTLFDVTESGQRDCYGVLGDGIDDGYATAGNVDFSGTPRVTVFAAMRRLSDVGSQMFVELGPAVEANNVTFALINSSTGGRRVRGQSRGTVANLDGDITNTAYNAPVTAIFTMQSDISSPVITVRANGVQEVITTATQGTGNYSSRVLNLFCRNGSSLFSNANLYALIVAGGSYPLSTIQRVERILSRITPTVNL